MLKQLEKEGGTKLVNYLLSKAIKQENIILPVHYRDVNKIKTSNPTEYNGWINAMKDEIKALEDRDIWELVNCPNNRKPVKCRWVYAVKSDGRKRARLVAKGFSQIPGIDYDDTFSPVARFETVRLLMATAALKDWEIEALDVKTAFLYGDLNEDLYMEQPEGFVVKGQETKVYRLKKALYGLKQASLAWNKKANKSLNEIGFNRCLSDTGVYVCYKDKSIIVVILYVDDVLFLGNNKQLLLQLKQQFMKKWECRDLGPVKEYLGMKIVQDRKKKLIILDQIDYAKKIVKRFGQEEAKPVRTPLPAGYTPAANNSTATSQERSYYQSIIGSLLYLTLGTRYDITQAVIMMSQFMVNPSREHIAKALYIVKYVNSTINGKLIYNGFDNKGLIAYSDADWAGDQITRRSVTGNLVLLAGGPISWISRKQKTVALSSTEAEYMSLSDCSRQIMWIKSLFNEIGFDTGPIEL